MAVAIYFCRNYFDTLNAKAALLPLKLKRTNLDIPMVSGTITDAWKNTFGTNG
jgi:hypothetical protein